MQKRGAVRLMIVKGDCEMVSAVVTMMGENHMATHMARAWRQTFYKDRVLAMYNGHSRIYFALHDGEAQTSCKHLSLRDVFQ